MSNNGWVVVSLRTKPGASGHWTGAAVIRNSRAVTRSSGFVFTLMRGRKQVGTLTGSASGVKGRQTTAVQLASHDAFNAGPVAYRFQTGFGF